MSTMQFVVLLIVVFFSSGGPKHFRDYILWIKNLAFKRRVSKIKRVLLPYGVIFCNNSIKGVSALCFYDDYRKQVGDSSAPPTAVTPTFSFPDYNSSQRMEALEILSDFLYKLCEGRFPKKYFDRAHMKELEGVIFRSERNLLVPPTPDKTSMERLKISLNKYLRQVK
jgi:hypothetical protein